MRVGSYKHDMYFMANDIVKSGIIICLCGSTKFKEEFQSVIRRESLNGHIVLSVAQFSHADSLEISELEKFTFDALHRKKIDMCDKVIVINPNGYIGKSTQNEIYYAKHMKKEISYEFQSTQECDHPAINNLTGECTLCGYNVDEHNNLKATGIQE